MVKSGVDDALAVSRLCAVRGVGRAAARQRHVRPVSPAPLSLSLSFCCSVFFCLTAAGCVCGCVCLQLLASAAPGGWPPGQMQ